MGWSMGAQAVLILSVPEDVHAQAVERELSALGIRTYLVDTSKYPAHMSISMRFGGRDGAVIEVGDRRIELRDVGAIWWRRPQPPVIAPELTDPVHRQFASHEAAHFLNGLWRACDARWVNAVDADHAASYKPYQLRLATECGLNVPQTLISNSPTAVAEFIETSSAGLIYKPLSGLPSAWRETRRLTALEQPFIPFVKHAPVIFQHYVTGPDLRVTVVGEQIFAAEFDTSRSRYPYDIRMDMTVPVKVVELDASTARSIRMLVERLGLVYGAIDLKRDEAGRLWFLEINPSGQFLYVEQLTEMPIGRTLAHVLASGLEAGRDGTTTRRSWATT